RFILERTRALGLSRNDLVHRFGYRDLGKGHKALSTVLVTGVVPPHIASHLAGAVEADDALIGAVITATTRKRRDEARLNRTLWKLQDAISGKKRRTRVERERGYLATFRQHLQVQTERQVPSPIFIAALLTVARLRIVRLSDEALSANDDARDHMIRAIISGHLAEN